MAHLLSIAAAGTSASKAMWYATRGTGAVALLLLTASVVLGILGPLRLASARWPRFAVATLHRDLSLLAVAFVLLHVATTVLDSFASVGWVAMVIPFTSSYRPLWLSLGTIAFDLILALVLTSLIRTRLGYRRWRGIHWLAYASWPIAAFHGLGTGSDASQLWLLALTAACLGAILAAVLVRLGQLPTGISPRPWLSLSAATPMALVVFVLAGPLSPNWAKRAGTPAKLLFGGVKLPATAAATTQHASSSTPPPASNLSQPFNARIDGTVRQSSTAGGALVDIRLALHGGPGGRGGGALRIRMAGQPLPGGGIQMTGSQVDLTPSAGAPLMTGSLTSLDGSQLTAQVIAATGARLNLHVQLQINPSTDAASGELSAGPE